MIVAGAPAFRFGRLLQNCLLQTVIQSRRTDLAACMAKALVFLAPGGEEMEFTITVDVLRRAGVNVTVAGVKGKDPVECSRGVVIVPDTDAASISDYLCFDAVVLPGGLGGTKAMAESSDVGKIIKAQECTGRILAAICAAPLALKAHGVGFGKYLTSYPGVMPDLIEGNNYMYKTDDVVVDGSLITSRGPGTAFQFALTLVEILASKEKACEVAKAMLYPYPF